MKTKLLFLFFMFNFNVMYVKCQELSFKYYVTPLGNDSNIGTSSELAFKTISYTLSRLQKSDSIINIIYIDNGLYSIDEHFPLTIPTNTKLIGKSMDSVIIDANYKSRVIVVDNSNNVIIQNITITKGLYCDSLVLNKENPRVVSPQDAYGQGLYCNKSVVTIDSVFITNNGKPDSYVAGSFGIGCSFKNSNIKILNSEISNNYIKPASFFGGGIFVDSCQLYLCNVKIHDHYHSKDLWFYRSDGGGFFGSNSNIIMEKTKIYKNYCENEGSAIVAYNCKLKLNQCEIFQNNVVFDGYHFLGSLCFFADSTNCFISNTIIHSNNSNASTESTVQGPFIFSMDHADSLTLSNVTITNNNIKTNGSVVRGSMGKLKVLNSIIWSNNFHYYGGNNNVSFSDIQGLPDSQLTSNNINKDPLFNDSIPYVLSIKSPCINKGRNIDYNPQTDFMGNPRIFAGQIDIGALEYQNSSGQVLVVSPDTLTIDGFKNSTAKFGITSNANWTVESNQPWLTISNSKGFGNAENTLTASANSTNGMRTATVTVHGNEIIKQAIEIVQESERTSKLNILVYPNPASASLYVITNEPKSSLLIFDCQGNFLINKTILNNPIDISELPSGLYIIKIISANYEITRKIIKK